MGMYLAYVSMHSSCKLYADTALRQAPNLMRFKQEQRKLSEPLEWMNEWMMDPVHGWLLEQYSNMPYGLTKDCLIPFKKKLPKNPKYN